MHVRSGLAASTFATLTPMATSLSSFQSVSTSSPILVSSVQSVSTSSATSSPTSTPATVEKQNFKFPSIAMTGSGFPQVTKLFTLHSSNSSITLHIKGSSGWQAWGQVSLSTPPVQGSPLAAASFIDGDYDQVSSSRTFALNRTLLTLTRADSPLLHQRGYRAGRNGRQMPK